MSKRFRFTGAYQPHFLRQWRDSRGMSLEAMAEAIIALDAVNGGLTKASLSRIETGKTPYTRDTLEVYSMILGCHPVDLLTRAPSDPEGIWTIWARLRQIDRGRALALLAVLVGHENRDGINLPAGQHGRGGYAANRES